MAKLTKKHVTELWSLWESADSGQLNINLSTFIKRSVEMVEKCPELFRTRKDITQHLETLVDLINTTIYK